MAYQFTQIITIAADSVDKLRGMDVYRVVNDANDQGKMNEFAEWLVAKRPDLKVRIADAIIDVIAGD